MEKGFSGCGRGAGAARDARLVPRQPDAEKNAPRRKALYQHLAFQRAGQRPINRQIDALVDLKEEIRMVIEQLVSDREKIILEMYYLENKSYSQIGNELGYHSESVRHIVKAAVKKVIVPQK